MDKKNRHVAWTSDSDDPADRPRTNFGGDDNQNRTWSPNRASSRYRVTRPRPESAVKAPESSIPPLRPAWIPTGTLRRPSVPRPSTSAIDVPRTKEANFSQLKQSKTQSNSRRPKTVQDWGTERELDCIKGKASVKRRYWSAVNGLGVQAIQNEGVRVRKLRQEVKELRVQLANSETEDHLKDLVFPDHHRGTRYFRSHSIDWSIPVLDNDVLSLKNRLTTLQNEREKKTLNFKDQEDHLRTLMENIAKIRDDPLRLKIQRKTSELEVMKLKMMHSENVKAHYKKCLMLIRSGNVMLMKKVDKLEKDAEKVMIERWELYTMNVQANNLRNESLEKTSEVLDATVNQRRQNEIDALEKKTAIYNESISETTMMNMQVIDKDELLRTQKTVGVFRGKGHTREKAYGPESRNGPTLRKLAYRIIRMKYEDNRFEREKKTKDAMKMLQTITGAEDTQQIIIALKDQKNTTLFLQNSRGNLQAKYAILISHREKLQLQRDKLVAGYSKNITNYDKEGRQKCHELEMLKVNTRGKVRPKQNSAGLIVDIHNALRNMSSALSLKDVTPIRGKKKTSVERRGPERRRTSTSLEDIRQSIKTLTNIDDYSPKTSKADENLTILLMRKVTDQLDDLLKLKSKVPEAKWKAASIKLGFNTNERSYGHKSSFQKFAENAIYANPRITWKPAETEAQDDLEKDIGDKELTTKGSETALGGDQQEENVLSRDGMKEFSEAVRNEARRRRSQPESVKKIRRNYHKYC